MSFDFLSFLRSCIGTFGEFELLAVEEDPSDREVADLRIVHLPSRARPESSQEGMPCFVVWHAGRRILQIVAVLSPEALGLETKEESLAFANQVNVCVNRIFAVALIEPEVLLGTEVEEDDVGTLRFALSLPVPSYFDEESAWPALRAVVRHALQELVLEGSGYLAAAEEEREQEALMRAELRPH